MFYILHDYIVKQIIDNIIIKINASVWWITEATTQKDF